MGEEKYVVCQSCKSKVSKNAAVSAVDSDLYIAFTHALRGPILTAELDYIDCDDEELHYEFRNFNPEKSLELLIKRAVEVQTSPNILYKEMKELISLNLDFDCGEDTTKIDDDDGTSYEYDWFIRFKALQLKYKIVGRTNAPEPESVTLSRLQFMFPHLYLPLVTDRFLDYSKLMPPMFPYPEFGGVIPSAGKLPLLVRRAILVVHLYYMHGLKTSNSFTAFRAHHLLINQRMKTGLLSNERRIRFLINNDVLTLSKEISPKTETALQRVRHLNEKFEDKIMWDLLDCI